MLASSSQSTLTRHLCTHDRDVKGQRGVLAMVADHSGRERVESPCHAAWPPPSGLKRSDTQEGREATV